MSVACESAVQNLGDSVALALRAADCVAADVTAQAFARQFAPGGALDTALTIALTLYVAFFAISLMLGRSNLSVRALLPRIVTIGLVLTFATSWVAFRSVLGNLLIDAPDYLATLLTGTRESASFVFGQKLDAVFAAVQEASAGQQEFDSFSPAGMMWMGATLFLLGTVGVLVTARIALAILLALGPIFVVLALFESTRGLFVGWLRGVVMLALTPLLAVLAGSVMLELAVPVLSRLMEAPGIISQQAAMAFFVLGAVHVALMALLLRAGAVMVGAWRVFGLAPHDGAERLAPSRGAGAVGDAAQRRQGAATTGEAGRARAAALESAAQTGSAGRTIDDRAEASSSRLAARAMVIERDSRDGQDARSGRAASIARARGIGQRFRQRAAPASRWPMERAS